jgi:phospholipid/cholesterol/gamma-HCH transport system permease protein
MRLLASLQRIRSDAPASTRSASAVTGTQDADAPAAPALAETVDAAGCRLVRVSGCWTLQALVPRLPELERRLRELAARDAAAWDMAGVSALDHLGAALLRRGWGGRAGTDVRTRPEHAPLFQRLALEEPNPALQPAAAMPVWLLPGRWVLYLLDHVRGFLELVGHVVLELLRMLRAPRRAPWREISANLYRTGTQALGITALVGFLIGVVLSFLSSNQLKTFGADLFIVNILGVSIVRELGPVLAAILVAGRSGSSMTAQIGVMRVTQELDAMSVMGIPHMSRLVLPKVIALAVGLPLLILWTDAVALLGGMVAANAELGLSYLFFLDALPGAVPIANLYLGVGKGAVFGILIALLACHYGMRIRPNTQSLGAGTTSSVVTAITIVIVVDAVFAVLFRDVGLGF